MCGLCVCERERERERERSLGKDEREGSKLWGVNPCHWVFFKLLTSHEPLSCNPAESGCHA